MVPSSNFALNKPSVTPFQGSSLLELNESRPTEPLRAVVHKANEQSTMNDSIRLREPHHSHGEPCGIELTAQHLIGPESNRPSQGKRGREEDGSDVPGKIEAVDPIGPISDCLSQGIRRRGDIGSGLIRASSYLRPTDSTLWTNTLPSSFYGMGMKLKVDGDPTRHPSEHVGLSGVHESQGLSGTHWSVDLATDEQEVFKDGKDGSRTEKEMEWVDNIAKGSKVDASLYRARRRNAIRLKKANENDAQIMSKYLPSDIAVFFPFGVEGPDDFHEVEKAWLDEVIAVAKSAGSVPKAPLVRLGTSPSDLDFNTEYLAGCDWDFRRVFDQHALTTVDHGSEFRPICDLEKILGRHPHFKFLSDMLSNGFDYHLIRELTEEERAAELSAQLVRGNHKSATESEDEVQRLLEVDVRHGFVLPAWESALLRVKGCLLQPGGMVRQFSLKADGSRKLKSRFTHDLSFSLTSEDASVNQRVDMERYPDMVYGWCLQRILHYLAALRSRFPSTRIYLSKFDYSDAYKRLSQSPKATASTVVRFGKIAYFCWRMVFGGSPNPAGFSCFSETLTDLANEIAMSDYSPEMGSVETVRVSHLIPKEVEDDSTPIGTAILPALEVNTKATSYRDCFIDDVIDCHLGTPENLSRAPHVVQLAVQAMSRPHAGEAEPIPRKPLLSPEKLEAEGRSSEIQTVLGWEIRTRPFVVALPFDKYKAWKEDLDKVIDSSQATQQETESLIGRLNHASFLIPLSRHFLNEIRAKCLSVQRRKGQHIRFTQEERKDLILWLHFLKSAREGISINLLVVRTPTRLAWSDSCPFGLGGYTLGGTAWRIRVPQDCNFYGDDSVNNILEFLGMAISILLLLHESRQGKESFPCLLVLGDNTSAISWLFRSGRVPRSSRYYSTVKAIARKIAKEVTNYSAQLCSQHIAGSMNTISDLLSFEGQCRKYSNPLTKDCPSDDILTQRILTHHSQIVPAGFRIRRLPSEIELFALSTMRIIAKSWSQGSSPPTKEATGIGDDGQSSSEDADWGVTLSSIRYQEETNASSWPEVSSCCAEYSTSTNREDLLQSVRNQWYRRLCEMPLAAWHRRLGGPIGRAPSTSRTESMVKDRCTPK